MNVEELKASIASLKEVQQEIQNKIDALEKKLEKLNPKKQKINDIVNTNSEFGFYSYLIITKKLNDHTAHNYFSHLRGIKKKLEKYENYKFDGEIYNISDKEVLLEIKNQMGKCKKLQEANKLQHNAFTAAFNNYVTYIYEYYNKGKKVLLSSEFVFDD